MSESVSHQTLLEQLQACSTQDERERLLMRFTLERLPEHLRAAVQAAAVPRFFDRAFLNALLDQPLNEAQFDELTDLSYIEPYPGEGRFNVHERSRKLLQEQLWQENEALYREISRRAFQYCKKQDQDDISWRIETVYHQLIAEPEKGAVALNDTCVDWMNPPHFAYDKAESLLRAVREHQEMQQLPEKARQYFLLNLSRMDIRYCRFQEAKRSLQNNLPLEMCDDSYLLAERLKIIGYAHRYLSEFQKSIQNYQEALELCRKIGDKHGEAECFLCLGEVNLRRSMIEDARIKYECALKIYDELNFILGKAKCLVGIGNIYRSLSEFTKAKAFYEEARILYRETKLEMGEADCLKSIGDIFYFLSKHHEARLLCNEALQLYRRIDARLGEANSLKSLGRIYVGLSDFFEARRSYEESLRLQREIGSQIGEASCLRLLGDLESEAGEYHLAQKYYTDASVKYEHIQRREGIASCWEGFAKLYQAQQQFPQAEEYWHKAADMYRQLSIPLREQHCLEQLRRMKEQVSAKGKHNESSTSNG